MTRYEVQTRVTTWAYIEVEAENEDQALVEANALPYSEWKLDTDWSSADSPEVQELENGAYL
jgi:hypothetical protein